MTNIRTWLLWAALALLAGAWLSSCRAAQVLTSDTITTDSTRRQQLERVLTVTLAADGRTATVHELETYTQQARRETTTAHQAPAPPKPPKARAPWYDRWARRIALGTLLAVGLTVYLKFFSPLRFL